VETRGPSHNTRDSEHKEEPEKIEETGLQMLDNKVSARGEGMTGCWVLCLFLEMTVEFQDGMNSRRQTFPGGRHFTWIDSDTTMFPAGSL
jgi:hypothetical protein